MWRVASPGVQGSRSWWAGLQQKRECNSGCNCVGCLPLSKHVHTEGDNVRRVFVRARVKNMAWVVTRTDARMNPECQPTRVALHVFCSCHTQWSIDDAVRAPRAPSETHRDHRILRDVFERTVVTLRV